MTTNINDLRALWIASYTWDYQQFICLFGEVRGRDLVQKFNYTQGDVLSFFFRECNDDEIEKLIQLVD